MRLFFIILLALPAFCLGQEVRQISLDDAIEIGLVQNMLVKKGALQQAQQALNIQQIQSAGQPTLNFQHGWNAGLGSNLSISTGNRSLNPFFSTNMGVGTTVPLFEQGRLNHFWKPSLNFDNFPALLEAQAQQEALSYQLNRTKEEVTFGVLTAFLALINHSEQIKLRQNDLNLQKEQLEKLLLLIKGGQRAESEKFQQESAIAQADFQLLKAQQAKRTEEIRLVQSLRLDPLKKYNFILPTLSPIREPFPMVLDSLIRESLANRADVQAQQLSVSAREYALKTARTGHLPTLSASANVGTSYASQASGVIPRQYFDNLNGSVGLTLNVPLIDNGSFKRRVQNAQIAYEQSILDLENTQQIVAAEISIAHQEYLAAYEQFKSAEFLVSIAEKTLVAEENRFNLGVSTLYERNQAQKSLTDAQSERLQASFEYIFRKYILDYYLGK